MPLRVQSSGHRPGCVTERLSHRVHTLLKATLLPNLLLKTNKNTHTPIKMLEYSLLAVLNSIFNSKKKSVYIIIAYNQLSTVFF